MTQAQALQIKNELIEFAKKYGLWVEEKMIRKPDLKDIILTISLRITKNDQ
jgi:hypothetical protein